MSDKSLYERLGGYDAITAVCNDLLPRLEGDAALGRFWQNRGADGIAREKQLLIDYLANASGGPVYYTGRDMVATHKGMMISDSDWTAFIDHLTTCLKSFNLPEAEFNDVMGFVDTLKGDMVE